MWHRFLPEASYGLQALLLPASSVCVFVHQSWVFPQDNTSSSENHQIWTRSAKHLGLDPFLKVENILLTFIIEVKFNLTVKIYPYFVCLHCFKSPWHAGSVGIVICGVTWNGPDVAYLIFSTPCLLNALPTLRGRASSGMVFTAKPEYSVSSNNIVHS